MLLLPLIFRIYSFNVQSDFNEYAALHKFLLSMQLAFKKADTDGNGRLDSAEIHNALRESGFNINFNGSTPFPL